MRHSEEFACSLTRKEHGMFAFLYRIVFLAIVVCFILTLAFASSESTVSASQEGNILDSRLERVLQNAGFTGRIQSTLVQRVGRPIDPQLANVGRLLWFDTITGLN